MKWTKRPPIGAKLGSNPLVPNVGYWRQPAGMVGMISVLEPQFPFRNWASTKYAPDGQIGSSGFTSEKSLPTSGSVTVYCGADDDLSDYDTLIVLTNDATDEILVRRGPDVGGDNVLDYYTIGSFDLTSYQAQGIFDGAPKWFTFTWTQEGAGGTNYMYMNGELVAQVSTNYSFTANSPLDVVELGNRAGQGNAWSMVSNDFMLHDWALSLDEVRSLHENPWQIFEPASRFAFADVPEEVQYNTIKKSWTEQPPPGTKIDWSNPLTTDMIFMGTSLDGNAPMNHVDNLISTQDTGATGVTIVPTEKGFATVAGLDEFSVGWKWVEADLNYESLRQKVINTDKITVLAVAKNNKSLIGTTGTETIFNWSGSGDDVFSIAWGQGEDLSCSMGGVSGVITDGLHPTNSPYGADEWNTVGGYYDGSNVYARINSTISSGAAKTGNIASSDLDNNVPYLGSGTSGSSSSWDGNVLLGIMWTRVLSNAEWNSLVDNPWQIFEPEEIHVPFNKALPKLATIEEPTVTKMPERPPK